MMHVQYDFGTRSADDVYKYICPDCMCVFIVIIAYYYCLSVQVSFQQYQSKVEVNSNSINVALSPFFLLYNIMACINHIACCAVCI